MTFQKTRLLLVEDDIALAKATLDLLRAFGYEVDWAASREAAYREVARDGYQAVLLDLNLGSERGEDIISSLRADGHHIPPIIILSAQEVCELRSVGRQVGAAAVLQKPCSWHVLRGTIERVVHTYF